MKIRYSVYSSRKFRHFNNWIVLLITVGNLVLKPALPAFSGAQGAATTEQLNGSDFVS